MVTQNNGWVIDLWRSQALDRFPLENWALRLPSGLWPAVADIVEIAPTVDFKDILLALRKLPAREQQERVLIGLFHYEHTVTALLDEGETIAEVVAGLGKSKREWLAYVGLYPFEEGSPTDFALTQLIRAPEKFRSKLIETLELFWQLVFSQTWETLAPSLTASAIEMKRLFDKCNFSEFIRHTLLPIEVDEKKNVLRALRGGYEIKLENLGRCTFVPSVFNDRRLWTTFESPKPQSPWFPYIDLDVMLSMGFATHGAPEAATDIALILRALGDTTRFALVSLLGRHPQTSVELASMLTVSKPTISHHIHILRSAGLIHETTHGGSVLISLRRGPFEQLSELAVTRIFESQVPLELLKSRSVK